MGLLSPSRRIAIVFSLLVFITVMLGCAAVPGSGSGSSQNSSVWFANSSLDFGTVRVGASKNLTDVITNSSSIAVTLSLQTSIQDFQVSSPSLPLTLAPGQHATVAISFKPLAAGRPAGNISFVASGSSKLQVDLAVSGISVSAAASGASQGQLVLSPAVLTFSGVHVGSSQPQAVTLTNTGGASISLSQATVTGASFSLAGLSLPLALGAGASANFLVTFAPKASGTVTGTINFTSNASNGVLSLPLSGTAVMAGQLSSTPASVTFGNVAAGTSQKQPATLTNTGGSSLTISQALITGTGFSLSGISLPLTLATGQTASYSVTFAPQSSATVSGNITFMTGSSTLDVPLTGTGLAAGSLSANPASLNLGSVQVGSQQSQMVTLMNGSATSVTVSRASASGTGFRISGLALPVTLAAGQSASFSVVFSPVASGAASGTLSISSNATNPTLNLPLSATGVTPGVLTANPPSLAFGGLQAGGSQAQSETLTNSGGSSVTISQITSSGAGFRLGVLNLPSTLSVGQSLTLTVTFAPQSSGSASGSLTVSSNASNPTLSVSLSGTSSGPGQLSLTPTTMSFGSVAVGASESQMGTLTASTGSVTVTSAASNSAEFLLSGLSFPLTLAPGQNASFTLTFHPAATGAASGVISFASNATNPLTVSAAGNGTSAPQHSVGLSWSADRSTVAGYNVYRGAQSGGPYVRINSATDATTTYIDNTVVAGDTYYYVVTAVDSSGSESGYSNQVQTTIPTP
ncbi:MAG TPA: choice-of-anchor D domain-containing protein [Terriglobales bacterium]|nr:choice-of-anchor D domain-containing protein [Terriglobales bacterium]